MDRRTVLPRPSVPRCRFRAGTQPRGRLCPPQSLTGRRIENLTRWLRQGGTRPGIQALADEWWTPIPDLPGSPARVIVVAELPDPSSRLFARLTLRCGAGLRSRIHRPDRGRPVGVDRPGDGPRRSRRGPWRSEPGRECPGKGCPTASGAARPGRRGRPPIPDQNPTCQDRRFARVQPAIPHGVGGGQGGARLTARLFVERLRWSNRAGSCRDLIDDGIRDEDFDPTELQEIKPARLGQQDQGGCVDDAPRRHGQLPPSVHRRSPGMRAPSPGRVRRGWGPAHARDQRPCPWEILPSR